MIDVETKTSGKNSEFRILIADDEESNLVLFQDVLQSGSMGDFSPTGGAGGGDVPGENDSAVPSRVSFDLLLCKQADKAVEAVSKAVETDRPFAIAFLDVRMPPGPDGVWAAQEIRKLDSQIEIVIVTGFSDYHPNEISRLVLPSHKLLYVHKPYHIHEIFQTARSLAAKWRNDRELLAIKKELEIRVEKRTVELARVNEELLRDISIRRKAENALRQSEERYRSLTESIADGVVMIKKGRIEFANPAFAEMVDCPAPERLLNNDIYDFVVPEFQSDFATFMENLSETEKNGENYQCLCVAKTGRRFWLEGRFNAVRWQDSKVVLGAARDITERKERELAMRKETRQYQNQLTKLRSTLKERYRFQDIIGKSKPMQEIYELILNASASDANAVIYGESGTGKELVAKTIHDLSERAKSTFVPVNCGAVPESLFESEFFGHKKGSFTGAISDHLGFFDQAAGGTLFLDEVGEFSLNLQVKMLRAIEGGGYTPVGGSNVRKADVRIIAATNRNLPKFVKEGKMREDFFYRLNVIPINLPPLRERREDISLLVEHYLEKFAQGKTPKPLSGRAMDALCNFDWPGNIRQLQNVIQRYTTLQNVDFSELLTGFQNDEARMEIETESEAFHKLDFKGAVSDLEERLIRKALERTKWHKAKAANLLGLPRRTFFRKLKEYEL
jgi:PAS domain S-box-containing protein